MQRGNFGCVFVAAIVLGIIAVVLSFVAFASRLKDPGSEIFGSDCVEPNSSAYAVSLVAAIVLLVEQILVSVGTTCFCGRRQGCPSGSSGASAIILFIISWISFLISFSLLIYTARLNNYGYITNTFRGTINVCLSKRVDLFIAAAMLCLITIILGPCSVYLFNTLDNIATRNNNNNNSAASEKAGAGGVPTAQPYHPMQPNPQIQLNPYTHY